MRLARSGLPEGDECGATTRESVLYERPHCALEHLIIIAATKCFICTESPLLVSLPVGFPIFRSSESTTTSRRELLSTMHDSYSNCAKDAWPMPGMRLDLASSS